MLAAVYRSRVILRTAAQHAAYVFAAVALLCVPGISGAAETLGSISESPLSTPSVRRGKTMFVPLSPDQTGVKTENRYADPKMWGELYQEFESGSIGTGVAIGDYDNDGRPDLFVVSKTESCRLFKNLGGYKFEDVTEKAGVADKGDTAMIWKHGATFVDVNNDGLLDLYICRFNAPNLLYINAGDGTFKELAAAYKLDVKDASVMAAFCDYDRDGWLDVYIATNVLNSAAHPNGQRGYLFHNNRDGTFTNVTEPAGISGESQSHSATWWDYDNDGWPDLYVANDYGVPDKLYHNNRDGTFTNTIDRVVPHTSYYSMGSDLGDVNNDGLIDFFVADMAATTHQKDQHSVAESRNKAVEPPDGVQVAPKYPRSALYLNTGTDRCLEASYLAGIAASDWTWSVRFEDLDNDGRLDLYVTNGFNRDPDPDMHKVSMAAETPAERIKNMYNAPVLKETHLAFRNLGGLRFENVAAAWGLDQHGVSFGAAFGDLSGDGNLDLVYSNYESGVTLLRNDNDSGNRVIVELRGAVSNRFGVGAVVKLESAGGTQVRQLSLARGYLSSSEPIVHFGLGPDTAIKRLTVNWPSGHVQVFENLGVDRRFTVHEPATSANPSPPPGPLPGQFEEVSRTLHLDLGQREEPVDELSVQRLLPLRLNRRGPAVALGRLSGGDTEDVIIGGTTVDTLRILRAGAGGTFTSEDATAVATGTAVNDGPVLVFDADGDGAEDLFVAKGGNTLPAGVPDYQARLFLNDGHGGFRAAPADALPGIAVSAGAAVAGDFDRDGRLDLFVGGRLLPGLYPNTPPSALLINRGGRFEDVTDAIAPQLRQVGMVTAALWSDVDGDGWLDLLVALDWGNVKYFHNDHGKTFEDWSDRAGFTSAGTGWWTSIAGADFNGDGRIDYAVGNTGLNTQYHADVAHPALLYSGNFKGVGANQLVEAHYEGERIYPWRSRKGLAAAIPSLLKKYPLNEPYARATLAEIVGEDKLAKAQRLAATELRSGVFLSQPDGTYRFEPLPHVAQIAPAQGMVAGDFDGDGYADLYVVQNSFAPIPAVGRFDGGLSQLLRGDGRGHFAAATPAETGLIVSGDAKALVVADWDRDGWPDFLVTRNNNRMLAFHNRGVPERRSLRVNLKGGPGNLCVVGSRLTMEYSGGIPQTVEVYCGSGYASQSAADLFFGSFAANRPQRLHIRWPSGQTTSHEVNPSDTVLSFAAPAATRSTP